MFIKLTSAESDGAPIYIRSDCILALKKEDYYTSVFMEYEMNCQVKESPEDILKMCSTAVRRSIND